MAKSAARQSAGLEFSRLDGREDDETAEDERTPLEREQDDRMEEILSALNAAPGDTQWLLRVYLINGPAKLGYKQPWLFDCTPADLPIDERLRNEYGTGKYLVKVHQNNRMWRSFEIEVIAPKSAPLPVPVHHPDNNMSAIIQLIEAGNARTERLIDAITTRQQPAFDPVAMMQNMVATMASLKNLMPEPAPATGAKDVLDVIKTGMELAGEIRGGGGEKGLFDLIGDLFKNPGIADAISALVTGRAAPQQSLENGGGYTPARPLPPPPQMPMGGATQQTPMQPAPQTAEPPLFPPGNIAANDPAMMQQFLRQSVLYLIGRCQAGGDPELYAEWVLDNVPQNMHGMFNDPNIIASLKNIVPEMAPYEGWFNRLLFAIREMLTAEQAPSDAAAPQHHVDHTGRPGGHGGHPQNHGGVGATVSGGPGVAPIGSHPGPKPAG